MNQVQNITSWLQIKIEEWEEICSKHKGIPPIKKCQCDFDEGMEKGVLDGFYQVMEFIDEQPA
jgi:hypothetical protein